MENPGSSRHCELALPAGSLQCALYAFRGGADAVYFGLKSFSARKGAVNFSFEDVRKVKAYCRDNGKKFYVTLNTIVTDSEMPDVIRLLKQLDYLQPDGVIVQDLGIAKVMREHFPGLPLHGSTQLAVHTADGVKELQSLGFSRVVLSRELSFDEIVAIRKACPDVELKVFIHGALCYGFSGLCMASQFITGDGHDMQASRSANRGSCAQICRTWFHCDDTGTDSWLFSMKDLCLGDKVTEYAKAGIDSLKIEGRMKGPDYAYWCARYYRLLLDGHTEKEQEVRWAKEAMQVSFSRETTDYFFNTGTKGCTNCEPMVCASDPGHRGIQVGTIDRVLASKAVVRFTGPVAIRDGLRVVSGNESASFSLSHIDGGKSFISAGDTATINFPVSEFTKKPGFGTPVYCVSRHNLNTAVLNENIPLYKKPVDIAVRILPDGISVNGTFFPAQVEQARTDSDIRQILEKVFYASDKSLFTCGGLSVGNNSGKDNPFIPMSALKQIRRDFYGKLDEDFADESLGNIAGITGIAGIADITGNAGIAGNTGIAGRPLPPRTELGLWDKPVQVEGTTYLPLSPVMFKEEEYLQKLDEIAAENPETVFGLNNIAQVFWAKTMPHIRVFADVFLYTSNREAFESLKAELPNLIGSYELDRNTPFTYTGDDYTPPLFISRVCMKHNGLGLPCRGCSRDNTFRLTQNGKHYKAVCRNCLTVVTRE